jgi:signal peptidase II
MPRRWKIFLLIAFISIAADQATKMWARTLPVIGHCDSLASDIASFKCQGKPVTVIDGIWDWRLSMNPGSAFGLFNGEDSARIFLSIVGVLAVGGMVVMLRRAKEEQKGLVWALGLVAGGAIGNLIDRIIYGVVTDFVLWHYHGHEWPVFNVADVALVIGVGLMFLDIGNEKKPKQAKAT